MGNECTPIEIQSMSDDDLISFLLRLENRYTKPVSLNVVATIHHDRIQAKHGFNLAGLVTGAKELIKRLTQGRSDAPNLTDPETVVEMMGAAFPLHNNERFWMIMLGGRNNFIAMEQMAEGTANACLAEPRDIFRKALQAGACSIILVHNHPSGDPTPSIADKSLTGRLVQAGQTLGIAVLDHVVIGSNGYVSFRAKGWI